MITTMDKRDAGRGFEVVGCSRFERLRWMVLGLVGVMVLGAGRLQAEVGPSGAMASWPQPPRLNLMERNPALERQEMRWVFAEGQADRFGRILAGEDVGLQLRVLDTMGRTWAMGFEQLRELSPVLRALVLDGEGATALRRQALALLLDMEGPAAAGSLAEHDIMWSPEMVVMMDRALVAAGNGVWLERWTQRAGSEAESDLVRRSAIRSLTEIGHREASEVFEALLVFGQAPRVVQLDVADGLARMGVGVEPALVERRRGGDVFDRLVTVRLAAGMAGAVEDEVSQSGVDVLAAMVGDEDAAVAVEAARRLVGLSRARAAEQVGLMERHESGGMRELAGILIAESRDADAVERLGRLMGDPIPAVRRAASRGLAWRALETGARQGVMEQAAAAMASGSWRAASEGALLAGMLVEEGLAEQVAGLLGHEHPEVRRSAIAALGELGGAGSRGGEAMVVVRAAELFGRVQRGRQPGAAVVSGGEFGFRDMESVGEELARVIEVMGVMRSEAGLELCLQWVVKGNNVLPGSGEFRPAAAWALGFLDGESALRDRAIRLLLGRLNDNSALEPEQDEVRMMSAVSLGRLGAVSAVDQIRPYAGDAWAGKLAPAARWAVARLTGEEAEPVTPRSAIPDLFLLPRP